MVLTPYRRRAIKRLREETDAAGGVVKMPEVVSA